MLITELQHTIQQVEDGCTDIFALQLAHLVKQMLTKVQKQEIAIAIANSFMSPEQLHQFREHFKGLFLLMQSWDSNNIKKIVQGAHEQHVICNDAPDDILKMLGMEHLSNRADVLLDNKIPLSDVVDIDKLRTHLYARMKHLLTIEEEENAQAL
jgi:hypothetical protein